MDLMPFLKAKPKPKGKGCGCGKKGCAACAKGKC